MTKTYDKNRERDIYKNWEEKKYFYANAKSDKEPFTIVIPPPNITAKLHMGHAFNNTIQDILIRFKRMQGFEALWLPGTDHAAIATEVLVIRALAKDGITKESLGREGFLEKLWEWNELYGGTIINQLKMLGCSCDWDKQRFTMDEGLSDAVLEVFVRLYKEGKIYRGKRLVNWCTKCQTSISDAEVEHKDRAGKLYYFKYPIIGENEEEFICFATTRPETMLGDTAIAVNPKDERYTHLIGRHAFIPTVKRMIPIVADSYVSAEYGTGAVKVTPAHDPNDFEIGNRHNLPQINIMNDDGTINENGEGYNGLTLAEAREKIIEEMKERGLYIKTEEISHSVGEHDRCDRVVEPLLKLQWFVQMDELIKPAIDAYTSGRLKFNRERFGKIYMNWLDNIRDWCISRQLWWGHRIPAYYCECGHITVSKTAPKCEKCGAENLEQDPDVLDTWFSSALWAFSTLGWPKQTPELEKFYPTNVLVTDRGIIFHWVVRMVFMGEKFLGKLPFTDVFINGTVLDEKGQKMSKSLGNGIDPIEIIEEFGADALRLMLVSGNAIENDMRFFRDRLEPTRNFLNKLWNASRFVLMNLEDFEDFNGDIPLETPDRWILSTLNRLISEVTEKLEAHELGLAAQKICDFIWDEFCDWYVEMVKPRLYSKENPVSRRVAQHVLKDVLINAVKLLHPFVPFISEDIFSALSNEETIMLSAWAKNNFNDSIAEKAIERVKEAVHGIRAVRAEKNVPPSMKISVEIITSEKIFEENKAAIALLSGAKEVTFPENPPNNAVSIVVSGATVYLPLDSLVDKEKEQARLSKEQKKLEQEILRIDSKLSNEGFISKAPQNLIEAEREKRENFVAKLEKVNSELHALI